MRRAPEELPSLVDLRPTASRDQVDRTWSAFRRGLGSRPLLLKPTGLGCRLRDRRGSYELSRLAPPSVRSAFDEIRSENGGANGVELRIEEARIEGHPWMVARLIRAPEGLVDHTTLVCNVDNSARTVSRTSKGESVSVKLPATGAHNGWAATARTRQGGVLFSARVEGAHAFMPAVKGGRFSMPKYKSRDREPKAKKKWSWIVAASAVVVAGGITAGVLLSRRSSDGSGAQAGDVTVEW